MLHQNRVIWSDNGTLIDISTEMNDHLSGSKVFGFNAAQDYLYLGCDLPFNHKYFEMTAFNANTASISIQYWTGSAWESAVDIIDQTSVSGVTLATNGIISFMPNPDKSSWSYDDTDEMPGSGLETLKIYNLYWVRISFSANLTGTTELKYIGYRFCNETELVSQYPEFSQSDLKTAFAAGKTNWTDQIIIAAEYIIEHLIQKNVIVSKNQILDWTKFKNACIHKSASVIYRAFGADYLNNLDRSEKEFKLSMDMKQYHIDTNRNATLDSKEKEPMSRWMTR